MAEKTNIQWCKSSWNCWIGCTAIGPGCDNCYADALDDRRFSRTLGGGTAAVPIRHFGHGAPRYRTSVQNWNAPRKWNRQAPDSEFAGRRGFWPVFCASLADVFDNEVDPAWRADLWALIAETPNLTWLLVTKRIGNVAAMMPAGGFPSNVWLLITAVNQEEVDRDVPKLLRIPASVRGVSYEPALGPVDWSAFITGEDSGGQADIDPGENPFFEDFHGPALDWIIVGGESQQRADVPARPFEYKWLDDTIKQCRFSDVAVFFKQAGSSALWSGIPVQFPDKVGADPKYWPVDLRVQEFPNLGV